MARPRGTIKRESTRSTVPKNVTVIDEDQEPQAEAEAYSRSDDSNATLDNGNLESHVSDQNVKRHQNGVSHASDASHQKGTIHRTLPRGRSRSVAEGEADDSNGSLNTLGRGVKELVQAVQMLHHLGLENLDLPLPKIVVVGDQSTGKSSLIEGMSEIKVPRSSGTCTRCPLEINLSDSSTNAWSCKVLLCKKYMYEGTQGQAARGKAKSEAPTRQRPLGPWIVQDTEETYFASVTSKEAVPNVLKLAQLATLNPSTDPKRYMPGNVSAREDYLQVKFSPNVVRLDISGKDLPNLSFYDLPGVINVSDTPDEGYLVNLVKNLVKEYVQAEDSINLLAIPMTDDPANSSASQLIRELKAESRTLGVLTKPDRRQVGEAMDQWSEILSGARFRLGLGYFVIKNNPDPEVDHATARAEEVRFFSDENPWAELRDQSRFGTPKLQTALSHLLTDQIRKKLPQILDKVYQKAEDINDMLKELPEPLSGNLPAIVFGELGRFNEQLQKHLDGGRRNYPFQKAWNDLASNFRKTLGDTRPVLELPKPQKLRDESEVSLGTPTPNRKATINIESDDEDEDLPLPTMGQSAQSSGMKRRRTTSMHGSPTKVQKAEHGNRVVQSKTFDLAEIKSLIQDAYAGGVPNQTHPKATEEMIQLSIAHWHMPLDQFLSATERLCENMVLERVQSVFSGRQGTLFFEQIRGHCETFFKDVFAQQRQLAKRILNWELARPQTMNEEAMTIARDKAYQLLQEHRRKSMAYELICEQELKSGKFTTGQTRMEKVARVNESQLKPEVYGQELHAMSTVKGYYECAYSRFVDTICSSIYCELFGKCRNELFETLKTKLGVVEANSCERFAVLLAANPRDEERRTALLKEKEKIDRAQERLEGLMTRV